MTSNVIPLATLLDSLLQKSYHELTVLAELLPRKSDVDRKIEIVQFARRTRLQLVRLLALVKWAGSSESVQKCSEMSELVSHQSWLYEDTANQLVDLARHQLLQACMPNFSLAPALDVLCTGSYPRLPTCIQENIIPPSPLSGEEADSALSLLTIAIRRRLLQESTPQAMTVRSIDKGLVTFEVPHEFTLSLSVVGEDMQMPWRLVQLKILVGHSLPGSPRLVHSRQQTYLTQLVQSHLVSPEAPLSEAFACLHTFCLSLQLDCLHSQALQLSSLVCGSYVKVEEYQPGRLLRVGYWCPNTQGLSAFLLNQRPGGATGPKLVIAVDTSSPSHPLVCSHTPPLPEGSEEVGVNVEKLCLEEVIGASVRVRSRARLMELKSSLKGTVWEERGTLAAHPLGLRVRVPVKFGESEVVIGVDGRVGHVVVGVEPCAKWEGVVRAVEETEKALIASSNLSAQLSHLQCQLFLDRLVSCAEELGLIVEPSLPLSSPLPLPSSNVFYIRLLPMAYMIVCVCGEGGVQGEGRGMKVGEGIVDSYYLVELAETSMQSVEEGSVQIPQVFYSVVSMVEIDGWKLLQDSLRAVVVKQNPALLKRKLRDCDHPLPNPKRLCAVRHLDFSPLPVLSCSHLILSQLKNSLKASGISGHQVLRSFHGCPCLSVYAFPILEDENSDLHHHLSSLLLSCLVFPSPLGHKLVMVFSPLISVDQAPNIVLHQDLPLNFDLGRALLALWRSKLTFLSLALELLHYLEDPEWPLTSLCSLSHFGYDSLTVRFGEHSLTVHGGMAGIQLSLPPDCPQAFLAEPLQRCLLTTHSLPILLKGIVGTEETTSLLRRFVTSFSGASLMATSPAQVQLQYDSLSLSMNLLTGSHVEFTDLLYTHQRLLAVPGTPSPLSYLKAFFYSFLGTEGPAEIEDVATPLSRPPSNKPSLQPSPMPISSPSRNLWPSSPLPSIPQLPTPPSHPHHFTNISAWSYVASLEQFRSLVTTPMTTPSATPTSPLQSFLASMAQLCHFWHQTALDRTQQPPVGQLQFMSIDRGTYHYRTDTLSVSLSMEVSQTPSLQLALRALREGSWSPPELQNMTDFFKKEVACPPYSMASINSFIRLLQLPLNTLRSCVQLMAYHMNPPPSLPWQLTLCMIIPAGSGDEISQLKPGNSGVIFKGKLLLILQLTNTQDGQKALIPLLHDIRLNSTFTSRHQQQHSHLLANVDTIFKRVSQEHSKSNHPESSIFPAVKAVLSQPNLAS